MNAYANTIFNMQRDALEQAIRPIFLSKDHGILSKRVARIRALTTVSDSEREPHRPGSTFSVEGAIQAQVEREDLIRWSQQPHDFRPVPGLPEPQVRDSAGFRNLIRSFMP